MRLNRLDLTRYGKFTDQRFDFGSVNPGDADLHIIYGPNEAGKSTMFSGWLDLLFGIPKRSTYNFLHDYSVMTISAQIEFDGAVKELFRSKGNSNTLKDANGNNILETVIQSGLNGLDRSRYEAMFSLDDETLEKGGESILASEADFGQILFSADAGLPELSSHLRQLKEDAELFYKVSGRNFKLTKLKSELTELQKTRKEIDTKASDFDFLKKVASQSKKRYDDAKEEQAKLLSEISSVEKKLATSPKIVKLKAIQEKLSAFTNIPSPPEHWISNFTSLIASDAGRQSSQRHLEESIKNLAIKIDESQPDELFDSAHEMVEIIAGHYARFKTAETDLPNRKDEYNKLVIAASKIHDKLESLGIASDIAIPSKAASEMLREHIESHSGIISGLKTAKAEFELASAKQISAEEKLKSTGVIHGDVSILTILFNEIKTHDLSRVIKENEAKANEYIGEVKTALLALSPWNGTAEELAQQIPPDIESLKALAKELASADNNLSLASQAVSAQENEILTQKSGFKITADNNLLSKQEIADARKLRETLWASHKARLDISSADEFEAAMRIDDQLASKMLSVQKQEIERNVEVHNSIRLKEHLEELKNKSSFASDQLDKLKRNLREGIQKTSAKLDVNMSAQVFEKWLENRSYAIEIHSKAVIFLNKVQEDIKETDRAKNALKDALQACDVAVAAEASFNFLYAQTQTILEKAKDVAGLTESKLEATKNFKGRQSTLNDTLDAEKKWTDEWKQMCTQSGFSNALEISILTMRQALSSFDELSPLLSRQSDLDSRISKMEKDIAEFSTEVESIAEKLSIKNEPTELTWKKIVERGVKSKDTNFKREDFLSQIMNLREELSNLILNSENDQKHLAKMLEFFSAEDNNELEKKLKDCSERKALKFQLTELEEEICDLLESNNIDEATEIVDKVDFDQMKNKLNELKVERDSGADQTRELFAEHRDADKKMDELNGDQSIAVLDEKIQLTLLEIQDQAHQHLRKRLGVLTVENILKEYRNKHQSEMMKNASHAFSTISRGAYKNLTSMSQGDKDVLVAIASDGSSKEANKLSKGTRFQLYLALRVAGYNEFAKSNSTVPFIADDILETFDDDRSAETFKLLEDMAKVGQVIYLTHHQHLCEIAKQTCKSVRIHEF